MAIECLYYGVEGAGPKATFILANATRISLLKQGIHYYAREISIYFLTVGYPRGHQTPARLGWI